MKTTENLIFGFILGSVFPVFLALSFFVVWFYADQQTVHAPFYLGLGILAGILIDLKFLKYWTINRYSLPIWFVAGIYIFLNLCMFGFLMGFPVFNVLWGALAGYYWGKRMQNMDLPSSKCDALTKKVSAFAAMVMFLICCSSGLIVLSYNGSGSEIQHMFRLGFQISKIMLWETVILGGLFLTATTFYITEITMRETLQK